MRYRVPLRDKEVALKDVRVEVELGFDQKLGFAEASAASIATSRPCSPPGSASSAMPASTSARWTASPSPPNGEEDELRHRLNAPAKNRTQDLYVSSELKTGRIMAKDEDVCLHCGLCAERCPTGAWDMQKFLLDMTLGWTRMPKPIDSINDFVVKFANVNGSGSASANALFAQLDPAHGRAGGDAQHLPLEHPGPADLVRGARHRGGPSRPARRRRSDGGDEPADLGAGRRLDRARRLSVLRFDQADAAVEIPRRHQHRRHAADRDLQPRLHRPAPAPAVQEHHLCRRARGAARHRPRRDRDADRRAVQGQGQADRAQHPGAAHGPRLCPRASDSRSASRSQRADAVGDRIFIDGNSAAALGAVYGGATVAAWYPITPSTSLAEAFMRYCRRYRTDPDTGKARYAIVQAEDELASIGIVIGAAWNGARAFTCTSGPGISLMTGVPRPRLFRRDSGGDLRRAARRALDRHADAHAAGRHHLACAYASHGDTKHPLLFPEDPARMLRDGRAGLRPRRPAADADLRHARSRYRHERMAVPALRLGRQAANSTAAR